MPQNFKNPPKVNSPRSFLTRLKRLVFFLVALAVLAYIFHTRLIVLDLSNPLEHLEYERPYRPEEGKEKNFPSNIGIEDLIVKKGRQYDLSPKVKRKLQEGIDRLENSEQYALRARTDGMFNCGTCVEQYNQERIFLRKGEVWRYGVSTRGEKRYNPRFYLENNVYYDREFQGNYFECLVEEKKKIFYYVLLPENLQREYPLRRPPMNYSTN